MTTKDETFTIEPSSLRIERTYPSGGKSEVVYDTSGDLFLAVKALAGTRLGLGQVAEGGIVMVLLDVDGEGYDHVLVDAPGGEDEEGVLRAKEALEATFTALRRVRQGS